jgi:hypothetical protein
MPFSASNGSSSLIAATFKHLAILWTHSHVTYRVQMKQLLMTREATKAPVASFHVAIIPPSHCPTNHIKVEFLHMMLNGNSSPKASSQTNPFKPQKNTQPNNQTLNTQLTNQTHHLEILTNGTNKTD